MASPKNKTTAPSDALETSAPVADDATETEAPKLDTTVPGGVYIVGGVKVDANGEPLQEQ